MSVFMRIKPEPPKIVIESAFDDHPVAQAFLGAFSFVVFIVMVMFFATTPDKPMKQPPPLKAEAEENVAPVQPPGENWSISPIPVGVPLGGGLYLNPF